MNLRRLAGCLLGALLATASHPTAAHAEANRFAIVIGANAGDADEPTLRYAESDAERLAGVLRALGGFQPENVITLNNLHTTKIHHTLISLNTHIHTLSNK